MVERLSASLAERPALFLLLIYWSIENPTTFGFMRRNAERHRARFPRHTLLFLCNTIEEQRLIEGAGFEAIFANQNQLLSEQIFRPLPKATVAFDAAYNAKLARFKRHHLSAAIERVIHVTYRDLDDMSRSASRAYMQRLLARSPGHRFANDIANGLPKRLTFDEVNATYSQAAVGLCLSSVEGAMFASMEYLLAGLPIVTTPSHGGRDVFFDPDYCVTVAPDPRAIRDAVSALRLKAIPREVVRQRTLKRVETARQQSLSSIQEVFTRFGLALDAAAIWPPTGGSAIVKWQSARGHIADYLAAGRSISR
jgi:hypothetical protein